MRSLARSVALAALLCGAAALPLRAQESALSDGEVDKLRETADSAPERVMAFVAFLDQRSGRIQKLTEGKRVPGREEDIHDLMQQMTSILEDLDDNLDDYGKRHWDIRKVLPKLVAATERWGTALKSPAEDQRYGVQRKLALEALDDVHQASLAMIEEQKTWFAAHPPGKPTAKKGEG